VRLVVATVGKPRDRHLAAVIEEYEARAARYWPLAVVEVREASGRGVAPDDVREREGAKLLERIPAGALLIACDERGERFTSAAFADLLISTRDAARDIGFVVGGAFGLPERVRSAATRTIQMAPWTLPHELARLVLAEQLYRAGTIARGEPYHK
jgi:23S rRNA (pseudouridine1915-N3)-methyltransferase